MGQSTISIRVDEKLKKSFDELCNEIGLSNSAAVTIFMKAAVREQRIPFELRTESEEEIRAKGLAAFHKLRAIAQDNGVAGLSLEEINEEIRLARRGEESKHFPKKPLVVTPAEMLQIIQEMNSPKHGILSEPSVRYGKK